MKEKKEAPIEDEPNYKAFYETYKNKIEEKRVEGTISKERFLQFIED